MEIIEFLGQVPGAKEGDVIPMFRATTTDDPQLLEPEKFSEWKWVRKDEIPENFINRDALEIISDILQNPKE